MSSTVTFIKDKAFNILTILIIIFLISEYFFRSDKIAYVDSVKLLNEYKGASAARKDFEIKARAWQSNIDTLSSDVQKSIRKYEKEMAGMSPREQQMAKQLIDTKQQQLANYQRSIQDNARQEEAKLNQGIVSQINNFLSSYGKKHNYKLILIANQTGNIAYAMEGLDITGEIVEELNGQYNGK